MTAVLRDMIENTPHDIMTVSKELIRNSRCTVALFKVFCHHPFGRSGENFKYTSLLRSVCGVRL
jgi:hypothetical protein